MSKPRIVVVGSVNLDLVASADKLPVAGETVTGAEFNRYPGGKGANQALAARRLGADVALVARIGNDANADEALRLLAEDGVNLEACGRDDTALTGVALIAVSKSGENQIVVAPGANRELKPEMFELPEADALICQLEVPDSTLVVACESFSGFVCVNLAPAMHVDVRLLQAADLLIVNETEAAYYGSSLNSSNAMIATTFGAKGAQLQRNGEIIAKSVPPDVMAVDTTGAGDAFTAALTLALIEGQGPEEALAFACATGACAATKAGAQTSLPWRKDVESLL